MNTNTATVVGIIAVLLLVLGGFYMYSQSSSVAVTDGAVPTGTTTGTDTTQTSTGQTPGQTQTATAPKATTLATVTPSNVGAAVTGTIMPNGSFTTYWYEYGTTANLGSATEKLLIGSGYESLAAPFYITGLVKDTTYSYRLVAENEMGKSTGQTLTFKTTVGPVTIVGAIPTVKTTAANGISAAAATVTGSVNPNKDATTFWFEYGKTNKLGLISTISSVGDGSAVVPSAATLQSLEPGTTYYYRLNAQNKFGTVSGSMLTFKTSGQAVVAVPVVTTQLPSPFATTTATLRGTVNPYSSQTTYWFEYGTDGGFAASATKTTQHKSAGAGATTVSVEQNITGLKSGTTYYYRTVAENNGGTVKGDTKTVLTK